MEEMIASVRYLVEVEAADSIGKMEYHCYVIELNVHTEVMLLVVAVVPLTLRCYYFLQ